MTRLYDQPKCHMCGRFCKAEECSVPFGGAADLEPPDDEFYCSSCAKREEEHAVKTGRVPSPWIKAPWMYRAAKRLGMRQAGPEGAAWSVFVWPDAPLEEGWQFLEDAS